MFLQVLINGILKGGLYALMALGMSLIWGVMDIINIAHGAFIMLGAYTTYWLFTLGGIDPFVSLLASMGIMFLLGYLIQRNINNTAMLLWTSDIRKVKVAYAATNFQFLGATIPYVRLAAFFLAIIISIILFIVLNKTRLGRAIRATSQDIDAARLSGVKVANIYAITFGIGTALAAAAGTLWAILFPISPTMGGHLTLKSFVVTIIGGLGTMMGPMVGGLALGIIESIGTNWFGTTYESLISFTLLVLVLIFMPKGILGGKN